MPVKIRLARRGRRKRPFYHIVVADSRSPRDGKFIEKIGSYNPMSKPATIDLDREKAYEWIAKGAQPSHTARAILKFKGVYYKKHLMRGVTKGALTQETADQLYNDWIADKEAKIAARVEETRIEQENFWKMVSGAIQAPKPKKDEAAAEAFREEGETEEAATEDAPASVAEAAAEAPEAVVEEVAEVKEEVAEAAAEAKEAVVEEVKEVKEEVAAVAETVEPAADAKDSTPEASSEEE